jgi:hypothetical protein
MLGKVTWRKISDIPISLILGLGYGVNASSVKLSDLNNISTVLLGSD